MAKTEYISRDRLASVIEASDTKVYTKQSLMEIVQNFPKTPVREVEEAVFTVDFGGNFSRYIGCSNCGNKFQERTDKPFDFCPYCAARRIEE